MEILDGKVSVILPVYNTEHELPKCLSSICNQTYSNLEIICVNDGSTDASGEILNKFAERDKRITVIHQKNSGESKARNVALERATGDYIAFCDCDDWIDKDMYQILVEMLEDFNVDLVASSWYKEEQNKSIEIKNELPVNEHIIDNNTFIRYLYMRDSYKGFAYIWNKLYRREIMKGSNELLFDENVRLGGDIIWLAEIALRVKRVKYIDKAFYHYRQRETSGCHTRDASKRNESLKAYEYVIQRFEEENIHTDIIKYVKRFLAYHSSNAAQIAYEEGDKKSLVLFQKYMYQYKDDYISLNVQYADRIKRYNQILEYQICEE